MNEPVYFQKPPYSFLPATSDEFNSLAELALDLRWAWDHSADEIWEKLDPALWNATHSPWIVLQTVSRDQFQLVIHDPIFRNKIEAAKIAKNESNTAPAWFQQSYPDATLNHVDVEIYFNDVNPDMVKVELFADALQGEDSSTLMMSRSNAIEGLANAFHYRISMPVTRPEADYTARIIPSLPNVSVSLEISNILWQH